MPRRRSNSRDQIAQDFRDAIERLKAGRPQNHELRLKVTKGKTIKINIATVAQEAGRARGLIAKEKCRYPEIRQLVLVEAGAPEALPRTRDDVIKKLRAEVAELRVQLSQAEAHAAYHFAQRLKAEKSSSDYKGRYERLKANADKAWKDNQDKVVHLVPRQSDQSE